MPGTMGVTLMQPPSTNITAVLSREVFLMLEQQAGDVVCVELILELH